MIRTLEDAVPEFKQVMVLLGNKYSVEPVRVFALWLNYSQEIRAGGGFPLITQFEKTLQHSVK